MRTKTVIPEKPFVRLSFYDCIGLLEECIACGMVKTDPEDPKRILVYRNAGKSNPEGWYSEHPMSIAMELNQDEDGQKYLLEALEDHTGVKFRRRYL